MGTCCNKRNSVMVKDIPNKTKQKTTKLILEKYSKKSDYNKKYKFISLLGNGSFGKVRLYKDRSCPDLKYAIKTIQKDYLNKQNLSNIIQEVKTLINLDHPNIVKYFETYEDHLYLHIVMEYVPGDNLYKIITTRKQNFTEKDISEILSFLFKAVLFLHHNNIIHRDIKPENILFAVPGNYSTLKLIDFGLSASLAGSETCRVGSPYYMAPEMLEGKYDCGTDSWSIGVILYVMLSGRYPFPGKTQSEVFENLKNGEFNMKILDDVGASSEAKDLILKLLNYESDKRLQISDAINHAWIVKNKSEINEKNIDDKIVNSISNFAKNNILQKEILFYLAKISTEDEITKLKDAFVQLDKDKSGTIQRNQIRRIFEKMGKNIDNVKIIKIGAN